MIRIICQKVTIDQNTASEIDTEMGTKEPAVGDSANVEVTISEKEKVETLWEKDFEKFNCHNLGEICQQLLDDEPVFILRAQDKIAPEGIRQYRDLALEKKVSKTVLERIRLALKVINDWRKNNKERIKLPD